jgi:hypothetical protein
LGGNFICSPEAVENCGRDGGGDSAAPSVNGTDALLESEAFDIFDHVTFCSRLDALFDQLLIGVGGDHEHADVGVGSGEAPACFGAAQARQARVEEYDVGPGLVYQLGELLGGAALADNLEIGLGLKDRLYAFADDLMIVDDENPDHCC